MEKATRYFWENSEFPNQVGFVSPDGEATARRWHEVFGAGPFFEVINDFDYALHHGQKVGMKLHAYYACKGDFIVEIVQPLCDDPSFYTEYNDVSKPGMNHIHCVVSDLEEACAAAERLGYEVITAAYVNAANAQEKADVVKADLGATGYTKGKMSFAVVAMPDLGALVQFVEPISNKLYQYIKAQSQGWDGVTDVVRPLLG
ncbi:MAG: VOC family protein [Coriobacteriales bacterium]|nr:VOC family protein [Coriobacteriales bacterium]